MSQEKKNIRVLSKVDSKDNWEKNNPILLDKEIGYERETGKYKIGNGTNNWKDLKYANSGVGNNIGNNEIFNDYINNKVFSEYTHAEGTNTVAGCCCWHYTNIDFSEENPIITLEIPADMSEDEFNSEYAIGDIISIVNKDDYVNCATILNVDKNIITVDSLPFNTVSTEDYSIFVITKPNIGCYNYGNGAHAEGLNTKAHGPGSHVEGNMSYANGKYSHAEGEECYANGYASHAEGKGNTVFGKYGHAEGRNTKAGYAAHAEGITTVANDYSHAEGDHAQANGKFSHAEGRNTTANGENSHAEGYRTQTTALYAHAEGYMSKAIGISSHAEGHETEASGIRSHAEGSYSRATGDYSHAEGHNTTASGDASHAEGNYSQAIAKHSHAEGDTTMASGNYSHSEGYATTASGTSAHAEGHRTSAMGKYSHAEGRETKTGKFDAEGKYISNTGMYSHAEGYQSVAAGSRCHAEGNVTRANGDYSHAEGFRAKANGTTSHAEGTDTIASGENQHVEGCLNIEDTQNKYIHIAGNGRKPGKYSETPSNAYTLDWNGNGWFAGTVTAGKDPVNDMDLVTKKYLNSFSVMKLKNKLTNSEALPDNASIGDTYAIETFVDNGDKKAYVTGTYVSDNYSGETSYSFTGVGMKLYTTEEHSDGSPYGAPEIDYLVYDENWNLVYSGHGGVEGEYSSWDRTSEPNYSLNLNTTYYITRADNLTPRDTTLPVHSFSTDIVSKGITHYKIYNGTDFDTLYTANFVDEKL